MDVDHRHAEQTEQTPSAEADDFGHSHHLECEILSWVPLLQAVARVRSLDEREASAMVKATLQRALAEPAGGLPKSDLRPWLLGLQRAIFVTRGFDAEAVAASNPTITSPARGASATWQPLHLALLRLPDRQREALVLADGAYCRLDEVASILACRPASARGLVRHARAGLLARLKVGQPMPFPASRLPQPRRPVARLARWARLGARHDTIRIEAERAQLSRLASNGHHARHSFARRLNTALLRGLWHDAAADERLRLEGLIAQEASGGVGACAGTSARSGLGRACRTSWLRLMFIAYACPGRSNASS